MELKWDNMREQIRKGTEQNFALLHQGPVCYTFFVQAYIKAWLGI